MCNSGEHAQWDVLEGSETRVEVRCDAKQEIQEKEAEKTKERERRVAAR